jgi:hypothetical protein
MSPLLTILHSSYCFSNAKMLHQISKVLFVIVVFSTLCTKADSYQTWLPLKTIALSNYPESGRAPQPTGTADSQLSARLLQERQLPGLKNTCGYLGSRPLTCPLNQYCAYDNVLGAARCCSTNSVGSFVSSCTALTACFDRAESRSYCGTLGCGPGVAVW